MATGLDAGYIFGYTLFRDDTDMRRILPFVLLSLLTGCGAEVAGTAAVSGAAAVQDARQAKQTMERVQQRIEAADQTARQQLDEAEKANNP